MAPSTADLRVVGRNVLFLSYWFPPSAGAGTQRISKACKYLPSLGWLPTVIAASHGPDALAPRLDETLLREVADVEVVRVSAGRPDLWRRLRETMRFDLGMDSWVDRAIPVARKLVSERHYDVVVTSLSPFSGWRLGRVLQEGAGLPWVLDLRDPWALDAWRSWPSPVHLAWDRRQMKKALSMADAVIANTPEAAREFVGAGADASRIAVVPNGFDEEDLERAGPAVRQGNTRFVLLHAGTLHSADPSGHEQRWRWRARRIDSLGRTGHYLLKAVSILREESPDLAEKVLLRFAGNTHASHHELAVRLGIDDLVEDVGFMDHDELVGALLAADALFVPLHGVPSGQRALVVPGKLYEALASGRPVIGALPPGDAADLVRLAGGGVVVPPCDAGALARVIADMVSRWSRGDLGGGAHPRPLAPFGRQRLAARLALVLERTLQGERLDDLEDPWQEARRCAAGSEPGGEA